MPHKLKERYYFHEAGSPLGKDTLRGNPRNALSLNRYSYVHNNPLRFYDPTGHSAQQIRIIDQKGNVTYVPASSYTGSTSNGGYSAKNAPPGHPLYAPGASNSNFVGGAPFPAGTVGYVAPSNSGGSSSGSSSSSSSSSSSGGGSSSNSNSYAPITATAPTSAVPPPPPTLTLKDAAKDIALAIGSGFALSSAIGSPLGNVAGAALMGAQLGASVAKNTSQINPEVSVLFKTATGNAWPRGEDVYLQDMFDMHKSSENDRIIVFSNRVDVFLNDRKQTYYYDTNKNFSVHGNRLYDNRMIVNAVDFGRHFGLDVVAENPGSKSYTFLYASRSGRMIVPGTTNIDWNLRVNYVETPAGAIAFRQSLEVYTTGWGLSQAGYGAPGILYLPEMTYTRDLSHVGSQPTILNSSVQMTVSLKSPDDLRMHEVNTDRYIYYESHERTNLGNDLPVTAHTWFSISSKSALNSLYTIDAFVKIK